MDDKIEKIITEEGKTLMLSGLNYMVMLHSSDNNEDFKSLSKIGLNIYKELIKLERDNNGYLFF